MEQFSSKSTASGNDKNEEEKNVHITFREFRERWKIITHTLRVCWLDIEKDIDILASCVHDESDLDILLFSVHADVQNKLIIIMYGVMYNMRFSHLNNIIDN